MRSVRFGFRPKTTSSALVYGAAFALALAAGACSTPHAEAPTGSVVGQGSGPDQAVSHNPAVARVDLEADGLEAQVPPPKRVRQELDDPTEPFSPNYGPQPVPRAITGNGKAAIPDDLPRDFRRRLASTLGE